MPASRGPPAAAACDPRWVKLPATAPAWPDKLRNWTVFPIREVAGVGCSHRDSATACKRAPPRRRDDAPRFADFAEERFAVFPRIADATCSVAPHWSSCFAREQLPG